MDLERGLQGTHILVRLRTQTQIRKNNVMVVGGSNMGKSFLMKPLLVLFDCYEPPDGGSYPLEDIKEPRPCLQCAIVVVYPPPTRKTQVLPPVCVFRKLLENAS